jgi:FdhE protein
MGQAIPTDSVVNWARRAARAQELARQHAAAADVLRFYAELLEFQGGVALNLNQQADTTRPLRDQIDLSQSLASFPHLLRVLEFHAPDALVTHAQGLREKDEAAWREVLSATADGPELNWFVARAILQPIAEKLQAGFPESRDESLRICPACGNLPQLAILRPEGEGARRSLQCSFCLREWAFRRVLCPYCGETERDKLPYYSAEECRHVRVEACDTCHRYLKSVDLSLDGLALPLVDEVALSALDIWANESGYSKVARNLTGF